MAKHFYRYPFFFFLFFLLSLSVFGFTSEENQDLLNQVLDENASLTDQLVTRRYYANMKRASQSSSLIVDSWIPYWKYLTQPKSIPFFQTNIGVGFLYFDQVQGAFTTLPTLIANFGGGVEPYEGKLQYNRTPLFEYLLGYRLSNWFKLALSYQFQSGITVQTTPRANPAFNVNVPGRVIVTIFKANLNINALMAKFYFEYPIPMIWKNVGYSPYIGLGIGPSWQNWSNLEITRIQTASFATTASIVEQSVRQKTSANVAWMWDIGLRLRSVYRDAQFFVLMGLKYNQWGQARNLGKMSQQEDSKIAFLQPFRIKTVYSFAPYLGVQWNFPNTWTSRSPPKLDGHFLESWKPFFTSAHSLQPSKTVLTEFNVGPGFLYFNKVSGSLSSRPRDFFNNIASDVPLSRTKISYNRTPLLEFILAFKLMPWFKCGLSYQHQSDISISTQTQNYLNLNPAVGLAQSDTYAQFKGSLILDGILFKTFLELPYSMMIKSVATSPYLAVAFGPGWQTWTQMNVWRYTNTPAVTTTSVAQPIRNKVCSNAVWMVDLGLRLKSVVPTNCLSVVVGCKYNQWGQARNLGKISQQHNRSYGLFPPLKIKTIYSFAPYLGVFWAYPIHDKYSSKVIINGRSPDTWRFYLASINEVQPKKSIWAEYSLGLGFLYFHKVRGQLAQIPSVVDAGYTNIGPLDQELNYNRTPLYEFLVGYRYLSWFKASLSYQTQRNVSVGTKYYKPSLASEINNAVEFRSQLQLNSFMAKMYFELPYAIILRNLATSLYASVGMGPSWQSWTDMEYRLVTVGARRAQYYKQKICANVGWMVDVGFRVQSISSKGVFSVTKGIKYIQWGQVRNLGELSEQGSLKTGLLKPISIQLLYSFSPYLGVQWNF